MIASFFLMAFAMSPEGAEVSASSGDYLQTRQIADAIASEERAPVQAMVGDRMFLEPGYTELENRVSFEELAAELKGCSVSSAIEADRSASAFNGKEPRVWWICADREPDGCFDIGYFGTLVDSEEGKALRVQILNPRNNERCPLPGSKIMIEGSN